MNMLPELSQEKIDVLKGIDVRPNPEIMNYIRNKNNTNELNASVARIYASRGYKPGEKLYGSININSNDYSHSFNKTDYLLFSFYVPIHKFDI